MSITVTNLDIESIRIDGGTQPREAIDENVVTEYAEVLEAGGDLPEVVVYHDGRAHWLADGFHRYHAHRKVGRKDIEADVRKGTRRDAIWFSLSANRGHGLRRTNEDKRRAVLRALEDTQWQKMSDRSIAEHIGCSHVFVGNIRREVVTVTTSEPRTGRDGKAYPTPPPPAEAPAPPPPEEEKPAGLKLFRPEPEDPTPEVKDGLKRKVTQPKAIAAFAHAPRFKDIVNKIHAIRREIEVLSREPACGRELAKRLQRAQTDCKNLAELMLFCQPYTECPMGADNCDSNCRLCEGQRWITEDQYGALEQGLKDRLKKQKTA